MRTLEILTLLVIFSLLVGALGEKRKIGFMASFLLSMILSPIIGLIIVLFSEKKPNIKDRILTRRLEKYKSFKQERDSGKLSLDVPTLSNEESFIDVTNNYISEAFTDQPIVFENYLSENDAFLKKGTDIISLIVRDKDVIIYMPFDGIFKTIHPKSCYLLPGDPIAIVKPKS